MASSRKSKRNSVEPLEWQVAAALKSVLFPGARLSLGLSGGIDSVVLLEVLRRLAPKLDFRLACVHVNHGISPNAGRWAAFCARRCTRLGIPLNRYAVDVSPYRAEGLEAAARRARYKVFAAQEADFVVLAQHQDDQAETLLLQLLRGAGVHGGAAMPILRSRWQDGEAVPALLRPMLTVPRSRIEIYAKAQRLSWVEDESNADTVRQRNFLRHRVLPLIGEAFPGYRATLSRAAGHLAEARALLDELAQRDAKRAVRGNRIALAELRRMGGARAGNLLRWFLAQLGSPAPEADHLREMLRQLAEAADDADVRIRAGAFELRRYDGHAYVLPALADPAPDLWREWDGARVWPLPELGGTLHFSRRKGSGLACARVGEQGLDARLRQGGEKLRLHTKGPTRSLKKLLQEARMPPWERERLPLLYCGDVLVAVPGLGVASGWQAQAGETGWQLAWRSDGTRPGGDKVPTDRPLIE